MPLKADADEILNHMQQLPSGLRLGGNRSRWPYWLFRSDHIENTAEILNRGQLLSRSRAELANLIRVDSGSPHYVAHLSSEHRNMVRLYFRPRTPTQYRNEGIRPSHGIEYEAHMPVPVYLLFTSTLLADQDVAFTKGRLEETAEIGDSAEFLESINFADVYHDSPVSGPRRATILNARHSEVVVEGALSLQKLKHIVCRSAPERDTLLNLLSEQARQRWLNSVHTDEGDRRLFFKRGTFVQGVSLSNVDSRFSFYLSDEREMRGPFDLRVEWRLSGQRTTAHLKNFIVSYRPVVCSLPRPAPSYRVRVFLDNNLAYSGEFDEKHGSATLI